jgi:hypothetical protein
MTGRAHRLLAFLAKAEARGAPSGWALTLDAAVAVACAVGAFIEAAHRTVQQVYITPASMLFTRPVAVHVPTTILIAATLTALPLAARRLYPVTALLVIIAAVTVIAFSRDGEIPLVACGTAVFAAYSAVVHSRYRNLAFAAVVLVAVVADAAFGEALPLFPGGVTAVSSLAPGSASGNCGGGCRTPRHGCDAPRRSTRPRPSARLRPSAPASPASCMTS